MPVRIYEIAAKHRDDVRDLIKKAKALNFDVRVPSTSLDRITAEALELAIYGEVLAVKFGTPTDPRGNSVSSAQARVSHIKGLMARIAVAAQNDGTQSKILLLAKELSHLIAVCKAKDWALPIPPEVRAAEVLIHDLHREGIDVDIKQLPRRRAPVPKKKVQPRVPPKLNSKVKPKRVRGRWRRRARHSVPEQPAGSSKPLLIFTAFETNRRRH